MVVGMVNAGVMTLKQAIGVILGANIGTTITGWVLALSIDAYGLHIIGVAALIYLFSKREKLKFLAGMVLGIGMVFFGLQLMKQGLTPIKDMPDFIAWFSHFSPNSYFGVLRCCLTGALMTAIIQSSSATLGITIGLASTGIIDFNTAAALVLGENIGTTVTALLASIGASTNAKRAAYAHSLFNIFGVAWITTIFWIYLKFITWILGHDPGFQAADGSFPYITSGIAAVHSGFNIVNTIIVLPLRDVLHVILMKLAPDKPHEKPHLTYLNIPIMESPAISIEQSKGEIYRMAEIDEKMLDALHQMMSHNEYHESAVKKMFNREETLDTIQKEIFEFLGHVLTGTIPYTVMTEGKRQLRMADEYESIGDYCINVLKFHLKMKDKNLALSPAGTGEILDLHNHVSDYVRLINKGVRENNRDILRKAVVTGDTITHLMKDYRSRHLSRVEHGEVSPLVSLVYMDIINAYRRMKDHALNIAETLAGEK